MGLRFRNSFQLFPGVRLNLSGSGISASFGLPGATLNVSRRGLRSTVGLPGSGLSYSSDLTPKQAPSFARPPQSQNPLRAPPFVPNSDFLPRSVAQWQSMQMREINSASVEQLTSHGLLELRDLIAKARTQRTEITADLLEASRILVREQNELKNKESSLFRYFYKRRVAELQDSILATQREITRLNEWLASTVVEMSFETEDVAQKAWGALGSGPIDVSVAI